MRTRKFSKITVVIMAVMAVVAALAVIVRVYTSFNEHTYTATVTDKEQIVKNNDGEVKSYYLIFCKDDEGNYYEFKNADDFLRLKFNSSSVYNQLEVGEVYQFTVVGFRIELFSWYENIIKFEKIN